MLRPIGVMDSGFGGLSVVKRLLVHLPQESIYYFGDNGRAPYGSRTQGEIASFTLEIGEFLVSRGIKALVVACNTATAAALPQLQEAVSIPVVGIIEPGAKAAVAATVKGKIAVIGTEYTINSRSYQETIAALKPGLQIYAQACPPFVPLVEGGQTTGTAVEEVVREYLRPLAETGADTLVLGCTHYPHLGGVINKVVGEGLTIIDPADATVATVKDLLVREGLLADKSHRPQHRFYTSGDPDHFRRIGQQLLGNPLENVQQVPVKEGPI